MITSIRIDDNKKTPFKYIPKIKAFKNRSEFIFKPGVNVIVGKNGSGKINLLNMISEVMLCEKKGNVLNYRQKHCISLIYLMMTICPAGSVLSRIILGKSSISYSKLK